MKELYSAFINFQKEFKGMKPDANNPFFKSTYITLDGILETVRPILSKYGLVVYQEATGSDGVVRVKTILAHESGQALETGILEMKPTKPNEPQALGSCITYAKRYQLASLLGICESVDDDGNKATYGDGKPQTYRSQNPSQPQNASGANAAESTKNYKCADCGAVVTEKIARYSYGKHKKILCMDCQK